MEIPQPAPDEPNLNGCARNCKKILLNYVNLYS